MNRHEDAGRDEQDSRHPRRRADPAVEAIEAGDQPFGSIPVSAAGAVLFEDRDRIGGGDPMRHPEFAIVRWVLVPFDRTRHSMRE